MASQQTPHKRPRLSLQIETADMAPARASKCATIDATAFNTLSNAYLAGIQRSARVRSEPLTAINTLQAFSIATPAQQAYPKPRVTTPYVTSYPDTPLSAACSPPPQRLDLSFPSVIAATPPLSAGTSDSDERMGFRFSTPDALSRTARTVMESPAERGALHWSGTAHYFGWEISKLPYPHPQSPIHSILRNSPLPSRTALPPHSPRRQSLRLREKAARKVAYHSPLTQEITTQKYTKSHIDLLREDASPNSPSAAFIGQRGEASLFPRALPRNGAEDGGQSPWPFEGMLSRMAAMESISPMSVPSSVSGGTRKRKKGKEKTMRWVWTIGQEGDDDQDYDGAKAALQAPAVEKRGQDKGAEGEEATPMAPMSHFRYRETEMPTPSIESAGSMPDLLGAHISDNCAVSEGGLDAVETRMEISTPTTPRPPGHPAPSQPKRDTPIPELAGLNDAESPS